MREKITACWLFLLNLELILTQEVPISGLQNERKLTFQITATVEQGKLRGRASRDINGNTYYSFQGIPYAKPPLGDLRFKAPQPPGPWTGVRDATKEGSSCYSKDIPYGNILFSEDCLVLNVYTPKLPSKIIRGPLKPVMVWIHGGGFVSGSGSTELYGPEHLMGEDVVVVTINYRLGIYGFMSFKDTSLGVSGNAGCKDMVLALKWVQKNIRNFSGDPNKVTVAGESSASGAVHLITVSPLARGLFHRGIMQSGSAFSHWARGRYLTPELSQILNMKNASEASLLDRLRTLSTEELYEVYEQFPTSLDTNVLLPFAPVLESASIEGAFLTEDPLVTIRSGKFNQVPMIMGFNNREGFFYELEFAPNRPHLPEDFETVVPLTLGVKTGSDASKNLANRIKEFYTSRNTSHDDLEAFYLLMTDNFFARDTFFAAEHHARRSRYPVYFYEMSLDTKLNYFKKLTNVTAPGTCHADDLGYLFKISYNPRISPGTIEDRSVRAMTRFWAQFMRAGDPNPNPTHQLCPGVIWKPLKVDELNYLKLGNEISSGVNPEASRMNFWTDIFKINPLFNLD